MTMVTYGIEQPFCVILQRNRALCALNKKILNLLNEESVSGESSGPLVIFYFMVSELMRIIVWICE